VTKKNPHPPTYRMREYGDPSRNEPLIAMELMALTPDVAEAVLVALRLAAPAAFSTRIYYEPDNAVDVIMQDRDRVAKLRADRILTKRARDKQKLESKANG